MYAMSRELKARARRRAMSGAVVMGCFAVGGSVAWAQDSEEAESKKTIDEVVITADRQESFSADYVQAGTFRDARILDTALTASVLTKELLEAQQALTIPDAVRNTAGVTTSQINTVIYGNLVIRGVSVDNTSNYRMNGVLPIVNFIHMPMENKSRVEVLKGASGLYYGFATPSGVINLVTERPRETGFGGSLTANSHGGYGADVDGTLKKGTVGLRVNGGASKTEFGVDKTSGERFFVSAAFDWEPSEDFSLQLDAEYLNNSVTETSLVRLNPGDTELPPLLPSSANLGAEWLFAEGKELNLMAKGRYRITQAISATFSVGRSYLDRIRRFSWFRDYDLTTGDGTVQVFTFPDNTYENTILRGDVSANFSTGPIEHQLIVGISQRNLDVVTPAAAVQGNVAQNYFDQSGIIPVQERPDLVIRDEPSTRDRGYFITNRMLFTDWLEGTIGYRFTEYRNETNTTLYEDSPGALSGSLVVKPRENLSLYATYIEGLEEGGIAPGISNNPGDLLPAAVSEQYEAGVKFEPKSGFLITAAYFNIERASAFLNDENFFVQEGRARYKGVEFSASGEITRALAVAASATYIDAKTVVSASPAIVGKRIENTPEFTFSLFARYQVPQVPGLSVSAGVFYTGDRAVNVTNDAFTPAYALLDLGAGYETEVAGRPIVFRVNAHNLTGKRHWEATGSGLLAQGKPRIVKFSVSTSY